MKIEIPVIIEMSDIHHKNGLFIRQNSKVM